MEFAIKTKTDLGSQADTRIFRMLEEEGIVRESRDGECWIEMRPPAACGGCAGRCGAGLMPRQKETPALKLSEPPGIALQPGDRVQVGIQEKSLLMISFKVYLIPLLCFLVGAMLASRVVALMNATPGDGAAMVGGVFGAAFYLWRTSRRRRRDDRGVAPVIVRRVQP